MAGRRTIRRHRLAPTQTNRVVAPAVANRCPACTLPASPAPAYRLETSARGHPRVDTIRRTALAVAKMRPANGLLERLHDHKPLWAGYGQFGADT